MKQKRKRLDDTNVTIVNPVKLFPSYETWLTVGTPSYCPGGFWINPPDLIIAKKLREMGCEIEYIDGDNGVFSHEEVKEKVLQSQPDFIVVNSETFDYYRSPLSSYWNIEQCVGADVLKETNAEMILYGVHPIVEVPPIYIHYIVAGEGETTVPAIIKTVAEGNQVKRFQPGKIAPDLNTYPLPAYDLVTDSKKECSDFAANLGDGKFTQIISSRGCPNKCAFCFREGSGRHWRTRDVGSIISEIKMLKSRGYENFYFIDDYFGANTKHATKLLEEVTKLDIHWTCQTRVDLLLADGMPKLMKDSGCTSVGLGIESYNDKILNNIGKPQTVRRIDASVAAGEQAELDIIAFLVTMLPGETEATLRRTEKFLDSHDFYGQGAFISVPYPSTPLALQNRIYDMITALERAGTIKTEWRNEIQVRRRWKLFDEQYGKPPVVDTIKKYRPDIYQQYKTGEEYLDR